MAPLKTIAVAALLAITSPANAETVIDWRPYTAEASRRFGMPVAWIERVMQAESAGRTRLGGRPIVSRAGAVGLMQLMPDTWNVMRAMLGLGRDPFDPHDNIIAGSAYLRLMYDRFGYPGMFAAYNAGPGRYAAYVTRGRRLPGETMVYLAAVTGGPATASAKLPETPPQTLFIPLNADPRRADSARGTERSSGIFAIRGSR